MCIQFILVLPPYLSSEIAESEAHHLISMADVDKDGRLSMDEIDLNYDVFVGSEAAATTLYDKDEL